MQETLEGLVDQERVQVLARTMLALKKEKAHISSMLKNIEKQIDDVSKEMIKMVAGSMIKLTGLEHDIEWVYIGETGCPERERMSRHRFSIRHLEDTPAAEHFTQPGHEMKIAVI